MKKVTRPKSRKNAIKESFGQAVREKRLALGWSQEELAEKVGLHFTYVSSVERGERNIALENIVKLARGLGLHPIDLMKNIN